MSDSKSANGTLGLKTQDDLADEIGIRNGNNQHNEESANGTKLKTKAENSSNHVEKLR